MGLNLSKMLEVERSMNAVAAGTTDQNGTGVDCRNVESVTFVALLGTLTAGQVTTLKAQQSDDDGSSDAYSDLEATQTTAMADNDDDQIVILEVVRPRKRYVRAVLERATQNAVIDGIVAFKHMPRIEPTTNGTTVQETKTVISPAEGTP